MQTAPLRLEARAKVNLYLGVHASVDADGYHRVDTVMCQVDLADGVTIAPAPELCVTTVPAADFPQHKNTAYKAACAMGEAFGFEPAYAIEIEKHIPIAAGLGGPSTDAAAVIRGLCLLRDIDVDDRRVDEVARKIGADVPFFLYGSPALLEGRGDVFVRSFPAIEELPVVLVRADGPGVAAPSAYGEFDRNPVALPDIAPCVDALDAGDIRRAVRSIRNNLAPASCSLAPHIELCLAWLRTCDGVVRAEVSGSGSCAFAICTSENSARRIAEEAVSRGDGWWAHAGSLKNSASFLKVL